MEERPTPTAADAQAPSRKLPSEAPKEIQKGLRHQISRMMLTAWRKSSSPSAQPAKTDAPVAEKILANEQVAEADQGRSSAAKRGSLGQRALREMIPRKPSAHGTGS